MRIAGFTDLHLGKSGDDEGHNRRCLEFVRWFVDEAESARPDVVVFCGDWHDSRTRIGVATLGYSDSCLAVIGSLGLPTFFLLGNHDIQQGRSREIHSLVSADHHDITLVVEPTSADGLALIPWILPDDDLKAVRKIVGSSKMTFGHFELPGFLLNNRIVSQDPGDGLYAEELDGPSFVGSGHFHKRQRRVLRSGTVVQYLGNAFPHDWSDEGDRERGAFLVDDGKASFVAWPDMPTFDRVPLSEVVSGRLPSIGAGGKVRIVPDVEVSQEELDVVLEMAKETGAVVTVEPRAPEPPKVEDWMPQESDDVDALARAWIRQGDVGDHDRVILESIYDGAREGP